MFYTIRESMDLKIVGKFFQSEDILNYLADDPRFLNNVYFKKIDFIPITPIPILHKKAKITDLISNVNGGSGLHLVMSEKLKNIIIKYRSTGLQFFKTSIVKDGVNFDNYFSLNMYDDDNESIDFSKTIINYRKYNPGLIKESKLITVASLCEFEKLLENRNMFDEIIFENIFILDNKNIDFFMIKHPLKYIVSEKLKKEIEDAGCTGIEFQPVELSYQEWTMPGGEREKIYGKI